MESYDIIKRDFLLAIPQLLERGLLHSSKWAAELLNTIIPLCNEKSIEISDPPPSLIDDKEEIEKCLLAKSYFDLREYYRAAQFLNYCVSKKAIFLRYYSLFLAGEKRKQEEQVEIGERATAINNELRGIREDLEKLYKQKSLDGFGLYLYSIVLSQNRAAQLEVAKNEVNLTTPIKSSNENSTSPIIDTNLTSDQNSQNFISERSLFRGDSKLKTPSNPLNNQQKQQGPQKYSLTSSQNSLFSAPGNLTHRLFEGLASEKFQRNVFISSIEAYPWNWSAWIDLGAIVRDGNQLKQIESMLPNHYLKPFWSAHVRLELQENQAALALYEELLNRYPNSNYLIAQKAHALYNLRQLDQAELAFDHLVKSDPYRLSGLDTYSNILYVKGERAKLSYLAYKASATDKYTSETCCIIGNYYSLRNEREKAILYFQRALKLNPRYLAAWTLIGHEYIELKNTPCAINAYRKAVDINPRDYRAWYSLGQAYELLQMPLYALYYFQKSCKLRPYDARMWIALGGCYDAINHLHNSILCYQRAESNQFQDPLVFSKLAKLFEKKEDIEQAAHYYKKNLDYLDQQNSETQDLADALLFLAYYCKEKGRINDAVKYASRLLEFKTEIEDAKSLLRQLHSIESKKSYLD